MQMLASYRHRFSHSPNFKALHWALGEQVSPPYCDTCHLFIPLVSSNSSSHIHCLRSPQVRFLVEINQTEQIESASLEICKAIKPFLAVDVCLGALQEYEVKPTFLV